MRTVLFIFSLVVLNFLSATAQGETRFYTKTDLPETNAEVLVGAPIKVSYILENGQNNGRLIPPDWEAAGFLVLSSSQSSNISIMNGQTTASAAYHFSVTPMEAGPLTIPSVRIKNGDEELSTEPITLEALPNPDGLKPQPRRSPTDPPAKPKSNLKTIRM